MESAELLRFTYFYTEQFKSINIIQICGKVIEKILLQYLRKFSLTMWI